MYRLYGLPNLWKVCMVKVVLTAEEFAYMVSCALKDGINSGTIFILSEGRKENLHIEIKPAPEKEEE